MFKTSQVLTKAFYGRAKLAAAAPSPWGTLLPSIGKGVGHMWRGTAQAGKVVGKGVSIVGSGIANAASSLSDPEAWNPFNRSQNIANAQPVAGNRALKQHTPAYENTLKAETPQQVATRGYIDQQARNNANLASQPRNKAPAPAPQPATTATPAPAPRSTPTAAPASDNGNSDLAAAKRVEGFKATSPSMYMSGLDSGYLKTSQVLTDFFK